MSIRCLCLTMAKRKSFFAHTKPQHDSRGNRDTGDGRKYSVYFYASRWVSVAPVLIVVH